MKIAFLDTDDQAKTFMAGKEIEGAEFNLYKESLSTIEKDRIKDTEILSVFVHTTRMDGTILDAFPNLKMIATRSTGYDHVDLEYCKNRKIAVTNVPAYGAITVAEFSFGLILAITRHIRQSASDMKRGEVEIHKYMGIDLAGKKLGVIGLGSIGRHVTEIAKGFGMEILGYDPFTKGIAGVRDVSLDEIYAEADIITLHAPSTKENYHMINTEAIAKMKPGVFIVNTARGDLIDTEALYFGLKSKKIAGAGLDVLEYEDFLIHDEVLLHSDNQEYALKSMINSKLMLMENVVLTPHIAFNSKDAVDRILETNFRNIEAFVKGESKNRIV